MLGSHKSQSSDNGSEEKGFEIIILKVSLKWMKKKKDTKRLFVNDVTALRSGGCADRT